MVGGLIIPRQVTHQCTTVGTLQQRDGALPPLFRQYDFQNFNLIPTMSAEENVGLALAFGEFEEHNAASAPRSC